MDGVLIYHPTTGDIVIQAPVRTEVRTVKRLITLATLIAVFLLLALPVAADDPTCATIQSDNIVYPAGHYLAGQPVGMGTDAYGFNYTAQRFSGWFVNAQLGFGVQDCNADTGECTTVIPGLPPYDGDCEGYVAQVPEAAMYGACDDPDSFWVLQGLQLDIKWNDTYRSRTDCNGNGWFDRHFGSETYMGSGAWYTNHASGYLGDTFYRTITKYVAVPNDAVLTDGMWHTSDGEEIGPAASDSGMASIFDLWVGEEFWYKGLPGLGRW